MNGWDKEVSDWKTYMRSYGEGVGWPSRKWLANWLHQIGAKSILDVGCGGGITYESLKTEGVDITYHGVDYCESAIKACHEMFPEGNFAVDDARILATTGCDAHEIVLLRHTLDHIDNWEDTLRNAYRACSRFVVINLWVPPEAEHFEVKGDDMYYRTFDLQKLMTWIEVEFDVEADVVRVDAKSVPGREYRVDTIIIIPK